MTVLKDSAGNSVYACDGCGRSDAGPNQVLGIDEYAVLDPNIGSTVKHHYCAGCAANRGSTQREILTFGWTAAAVPVTTPVELAESEEPPSPN